MPRPQSILLLSLLIAQCAPAFAQRLGYPELELSDNLLATLRKTPILIAGSLLSSFAEPLQIDEARYAVKYRSAKGSTNEVICDRLEDGVRTQLSTHRIQVSSLCLSGTPTGEPKFRMTTELENDKVFVELADGNFTAFVGTLSPSKLPNWVPELGAADHRLLWIAGTNQGYRNGYAIRLKVASRLSPLDFASAVKVAGKRTDGPESVVWDRLIGKDSIGTAELLWTRSGSEIIYTLTIASPGLNNNNNRPLGK